MKYIFSFFVFVLLLANCSESYSRLFRINNIPNGKKYLCKNCHDPLDKTYKTRNPFGKEIEAHYLQPDVALKLKKVLWQAALAALDSDNDGYTNGQELDDPEGVLTKGDSTNFYRVTNPGDSLSKPMNPATEEQFSANIAEIVSFITSSGDQGISLRVHEPSEFGFTIYSTDGSSISVQPKYYAEGEYKIILTELGFSISDLPSGLYFIAASSKNYFQMEKFIIRR